MEPVYGESAPSKITLPVPNPYAGSSSASARSTMEYRHGSANVDFRTHLFSTPGDATMNDGRIREIYRQSLEINRATFADGEYGIAYQVLLVALRCGQRLRDLSFLSEVETLAEKQSRYLDDHFPQCEYSSKAALPRGNLGLFQTAAHQARTIVRTMRQPQR
jgi:hypothetical protein